MTEPGGGTDALHNLNTKATLVDGQYVINGQKTFITNAEQSEFILTATRTEPVGAKITDGITLFLVPTASAGLSFVPQKKLGVRCVAANDVFFGEVTVPPAAVLGEVGKGWRTLAATLNTERITVAAEALGVAEAALDAAVAYANEREAFGRPIGSYQALQHKL